MWKQISYFVFSSLALSMAAVPSLADLVGVGNVVMDGTFLVSATTTDGYTVTADSTVKRYQRVSTVLIQKQEM